VEFGKDYKAKRRIVVRPQDDGRQPIEYLIPKGKHISVQEGDYVQRGDLLAAVLDRLGVHDPEALQRLRGMRSARSLHPLAPGRTVRARAASNATQAPRNAPTI